MFLCPNLTKGGYSWNSSPAAQTQVFKWTNVTAFLKDKINAGACVYSFPLVDKVVRRMMHVYSWGPYTRAVQWFNYQNVEVNVRVPTATLAYWKNRQADFLLASFCWRKVTFAEQLSSFPSNFFFTFTFFSPLFSLNLDKMHSWCKLVSLHWQCCGCADLCYLTFAVDLAHTAYTCESFFSFRFFFNIK